MRVPIRAGFTAVCTVLAALGASAPTALGAPPPAQADGMARALQLRLQKATLDNGLRVVMNPDPSSPNVAVCVTYDVGSRNEQAGRTGFAHLFEHMMFQGSRNVEKGQHFTWLTARGGTLNGTTSSDRTNYFESLPSNELALGLWLEADRMKHLAVTPENLENQRAVVQEEYRMRVSNSAYAEGHMRLGELVFEGYFPYAHDAIGKMEDLDAAEFAWVKEFHDQYYAPNNAVLTIVGDFDPDRAMELVREYFGDARAQTAVPAYAPPAMPEQSTARLAEVTDANAKTPGLYMGWAIPAHRTDEHYALELASLLLGDGESSRLHQSLVRQGDLARSAYAWTRDHRGPDSLEMQVLLNERASIDDVEAAVQREVDRLGAKGPTPSEMQKAHNRVRSHFLSGMQSNLHRATEIANYELFWGDARLLSREVDRYLAVTPERIQAVVQKYLTPARRSIVRVLPPSSDQEPQK